MARAWTRRGPRSKRGDALGGANGRVRIPVAAVAACALLGAPFGAAAQADLGALEVGDSVRLRLPGALRMDGSMLELRGDTLVLRLTGVSQDWPVSGRDLVSLERFGDRDPRQGFRHGAVYGMVGGIFVGALVSLALHAATKPDDDTEPAVRYMSAAFQGAGLGLVFGGLGGGFLGGQHPGRGWIALELPGH